MLHGNVTIEPVIAQVLVPILAIVLLLALSTGCSHVSSLLQESALFDNCLTTSSSSKSKSTLNLNAVCMHVGLSADHWTDVQH